MKPLWKKENLSWDNHRCWHARLCGIAWKTVNKIYLIYCLIRKMDLVCSRNRGKAGSGTSVNSRVALQEGSVTVSIHEMDLRISKQTVSSAWVAFWSVCAKFCFLAELLWGTFVYNCSANVCCHLVVVVGFKMEAFQSSSSAVVWEMLAVPWVTANSTGKCAWCLPEARIARLLTLVLWGPSVQPCCADVSTM